MATIVLIHGAFQGSWVWDKVTPTLEKLGNTLYCPHLPNLGAEEDARYIVDLIDEQNLCDIVLIGHSYGGIVISEVANQRASKIKKLIFLDTPLIEKGQSLLDVLGKEAEPLFYGRLDPATKQVPAFPIEAFGIETDEDRAWIDTRLRSQSLACFIEKAKGSARACHSKSFYIHCTKAHPFSSGEAQKAKSWGWGCFELATGHSPHISHPNLFIDCLQTILYT